MSETLPPKMVKAQLVRLDDSLKQIERRQVSGIQRAPGSLPVLEAFQAFLEHEQRKARRRMLAVTLLAVMVLILAGVAGFLVVRQYVKQADTNLGVLATKTESMVQTVETQTTAMTASFDQFQRDRENELTALENRFKDESEQIIAQYTELQRAQQTLRERIANNDLTTVENRLKQLEIENSDLQAKLDALLSLQANAAEASTTTESPAPSRARSGNVAEKPFTDHTASSRVKNDAINDTESTPAMTSSAPTSQDNLTALQASPNVTITKHPSAYLMTIIPEGQEGAIRWMLPRFTQE